MESERSPRARATGTGRVGSGVSATSQPDSVTEDRLAQDVGILAARIAANQVDQLDQLSLIGYTLGLDEQTRDVVETSLRLAARKVLES